jgi:hypothetical protein
MIPILIPIILALEKLFLCLILRMMLMTVMLDLEVSILLEVVEENVMNLVALQINSFNSYSFQDGGKDRVR